MKLIHYSSKEISSLEFREYDPIPPIMKPNGLWFSVEELPDADSVTWKEWCESENFRIENLSFPYEIILNDNASILHLKSEGEIFQFNKHYRFSAGNYDSPLHAYMVNWVEVKKEYQGIIIAPYQWDCRLSPTCIWYYGWDCASGCIWDITCIKYFLLLKTKEKEK